MFYFDPVDIGRWGSYASYRDPEQRELQLSNLYPVSSLLHVGEGQLQLIYTKYIHQLCEYLETVSKEVPITDTEVHLIDEVFYTSKIEGAKTTRQRTKDIHNGAPIRDDDAHSEAMILGGFRATRMLNLYGNKMSKEIMCNVWEVMVEGCCDNLDKRGPKGDFRSGEIFIGEHEGVKPDSVDMYMGMWFDFYNSDELNEHPFLKAALLHYVFENIHPFCDGNGRMGRLVMNNYLIGQGIESAKAVSFSMAIDADRGAYDSAFQASENEHVDCTPFIEYLLDRMATAYETALKVNDK